MLRRTARRSGFSLTEVLVALFVMALGIISLLTLFPVGAVTMGRALQDDRTQTTGLQADAAIRMWWRQEVVEAFPRYGLRDTEDAPFWVLDDPNDPWVGNTPAAFPHPATTQAPATPGAYPVFTFHPNPNPAPAVGRRAYPLAVPENSQLPSFPVLIDPVGLNSYTAGTQSFWNAGAGISPALPNGFTVPRRTIRTAGANLVQAIRSCTMFDDLELSRAATPGAPAGMAETGSAFPVVRQGRYNWAAVIQRENNANRYVADLKILVYDRRAPGVAPTDAELHFVVPGMTVGSTQIILPTTVDVLKLRTNGWIMDGTITDPTNDPPATVGIKNANFYRILTITEVGGATVLELQTPIKPPTGAPGVTSYNGRIYVMSNLIEVFDRPKLEPTAFTAQVP